MNKNIILEKLEKHAREEMEKIHNVFYKGNEVQKPKYKFTINEYNVECRAYYSYLVNGKFYYGESVTKNIYLSPDELENLCNDLKGSTIEFNYGVIKNV